MADTTTYTGILLVVIILWTNNISCHDIQFPQWFNQEIICTERYSKATIFRAVSNCKHDEQFNSKCIKDFNLVNGKTTDMLPVTDLRTNITYRSVYCARCNGVSQSDIKYWVPEISCKSTLKLELGPWEDILNVVFKTEKCDFSFISPQSGLENHKCFFHVEVCNFTHAWQTQTQTSESGLIYCSPEEMLYKSHGVLFKSTQCAACNGFNKDIDIRDNLGRQAVSFLLTFYDKSKHSRKLQGKCSPQSISDDLNNRCLDASCSILRQLQNNVCVKVINYVDVITYKVGIRLLSESSLSLQDIIENETRLIKSVFDFLYSVFINIYQNEYEIIIVPDQKCQDWIDATCIKTSGFSFIEWHLKVIVKAQHDPEEKLAILLNVSDNTNIHLMLNDRDVLFSLVILDFKDNTIGPDLSDQCSSTNITGMTEFGFELFLCTDIVAKETNEFPIKTVMRYIVRKVSPASKIMDLSTWPQNILEYRSCPFVEVFKKSMDWKEVDGGLEFMKVNFTLGFTDFVYGATADRILLCKDTYFQLENYYRNNSYNVRFSIWFLLYSMCFHHFVNLISPQYIK